MKWAGATGTARQAGPRTPGPGPHGLALAGNLGGDLTEDDVGGKKLEGPVAEPPDGRAVGQQAQAEGGDVAAADPQARDAVDRIGWAAQLVDGEGGAHRRVADDHVGWGLGQHRPEIAVLGTDLLGEQLDEVESDLVE